MEVSLAEKPKVVILAGGYGTRISEETKIKPKPLIEVNGKPIIWYILTHFASYGFNDFIICAGYKGEMLKEYFFNYHSRNVDFKVNTSAGTTVYYPSGVEDWNVTVIDTGQETMTGGRLRRVSSYLGEVFFMTYGDGVADIDLSSLLASHLRSQKAATVTAVKPPSRFAVLEVENETKSVSSFREKPSDEFGWINGGFFVLNKEVLGFIEGDETTWEREPMEKLASTGNLNAFIHDGFWQCIDSMRDKEQLERLYSQKEARSK